MRLFFTKKGIAVLMFNVVAKLNAQNFELCGTNKKLSKVIFGHVVNAYFTGYLILTSSFYIRDIILFPKFNRFFF